MGLPRQSILLNSLKFAAVYLVLGMLWITFSDQLVDGLATDREALLALQTYKGWFYVLLTALLAFALWYRFQKRLTSSAEILREAESFNHITLQSIGDAVIATDIRQRVTILNPEATRLTGFGESEAVGRPLSEIFRIVDGETRQPALNPAEKVLQTGKVVGLANHTVLLGRDGREYQIADSGAPILDSQGEVRGVVLVFRDVTSAYAMQAALASSEERLRLALRAVSEGTWEMDPRTGKMRWSKLLPAILEAGEYEAGDALSFLKQHLVPAEGERLQEELDLLCKQEDRSIDLRLKVLAQTGEIKWIRLRGSHLSGHKGSARIYGTLSDVTEAQQNERQLRLTQFGIENASLAIFQIDEEGRIHNVNRKACSSLGYTREELTRLTVADIDPDMTPDGFRSHRRRVIEAGGSRRLNRRHRRKDGSVFPVEVEVSYLEFEGRRMAFSFATDISQRKEAEKNLLSLNQELRQALAKAESSNRAKNDFLSVMSHEMRTPLNPVIGFASILREEVSDEDHRQYLDTIIGASEKLLKLIEDILLYADLDQCTLQPEEQPFQPLAVCTAVIEEAKRDGPGLKVSLQAERENPFPLDDNLYLLGDPKLLQQILRALLSNAVRHTRKGSVELLVQAKRDKPSGDTCHLLFKVSDTGTGIDQERLPGLFAPFEQLDNSSTREHQGIGLGLAICRKLVELLGGRIGAESEPGKGSLFWFDLPYKILMPNENTADACDSGKTAPAPGRLAEAPRILIVEDKADNALIAETVLRQVGARTEIAWDGESALKSCQCTSMDLILMDLSMPRMDGFETTKAIRSREGPNRNTPIVALSAHQGEAVMRKCHAVGIKTLICKPIRPKEFLQQLAPFLRNQ